MKTIVACSLAICIFFFAEPLVAEPPKTIKIACVGDSITVGNYPADLEKLLNFDYELKSQHPAQYEVGNFGFSGSTVVHCSDKQYATAKGSPLAKAKEFNPDIVVIKLGTNDSRRGPTSKCIDSLPEDYKKLAAEFTSLPSKPKIYACLPVPILYGGHWGLNNENLVDGVIPRIVEVAKEINAPVIDAYTPLYFVPEAFESDNVHPGGANGRFLIAVAVFRGLTGVEPPAEMVAQATKSAGGSYEYTNYQPTAAPVAPAQLTATPVYYNQINLEWKDSSKDESGFIVEQKTGAEPYKAIGRVGANLHRHCAISLKPETAYSFRLKAINDKGESSYSNEVQASTPAPFPLTPGEIRIKAASPTQLDLTWSTESGVTQDGFIIERKDGEGGAWAEVGKIDASQKAYSDKTVKSGVAFSYRVRAFNAAGKSWPTLVATAVSTTPAPPSDLTAAASGSIVSLSWKDNSQDETGFKIEIKPGDGEVQSQNVGRDIVTYKHQNLSAGSTFTYRVMASNSAGASEFSNAATASLPDSGPPPPTNVKAEALSSKEVKVTWADQSKDATGFRIESRQTGRSWKDEGQVKNTETTFTCKGLDPGKDFAFRVRAVGPKGISKYSEEAKASTTGETK